jgi:hypothetical protein
MPRYYHGGRDAVDPTKYFPESLAMDDNDPDAIKRVESEREKIRVDIAKAHPLTSPSLKDSVPGKNDRAIVVIDGEVKLKRPLAFCQRIQTWTDVSGKVQTQKLQEYDPWVAGSLVLALTGHGYWVIPPGGHVDLDLTIPESLVKAYAPHLLTEHEFADRQKRSGDKQEKQTKKTIHSEQFAPKG